MEGWVTRPHGSGVGLPQMLRDLGSWDGIWYRSIAVHGYDPHDRPRRQCRLPAALPAAPAGAAHDHPVRRSGVARRCGSPRSSWRSGMCLLYKLTDERLGRTIARRTVLFMSISPLAFVFSAVYAESLFLALVDGRLPACRAAPLPGCLGARRARRADPPGRNGARTGARVDGVGRARGTLAARRPGRPALPWPRASSRSTCGGRPETRWRRRTRRRAAGGAASACRRS